MIRRPLFASSPFLFAAVLSVLAACGDSDPEATPDAPRGPDAAVDAPVPIDGPPIDSAVMCMAAADDYTPRDMMSANDTYPMCVSDAMPDRYTQIGASVSTNARIAAFEQIATKLFIAGAPSNQDFIDSRLLYVTDNGLESRVSRREDEHYPAAPAACNTLMPDVLAMHPDRCVGPFKLQPALQAAFMVGSTSADPRERRLAAARVEGYLLWFLYVSLHKELTTCRTTPADCDSGWSYYAGGEHRAGGLGFARYVKALEPATHDRIFDGVLAVRCWRGLDDVTMPGDDAMFAALRTRAIAQTDRAALRGVVTILKSRLTRLDTQTGLDAEVTWEMIRTLGPVLQRAADALGGTEATVWRTEIAKPAVPTMTSRNAMHRALDILFPCP